MKEKIIWLMINVLTVLPTMNAAVAPNVDPRESVTKPTANPNR